MSVAQSTTIVIVHHNGLKDRLECLQSSATVRCPFASLQEAPGAF